MGKVVISPNIKRERDFIDWRSGEVIRKEETIKTKRPRKKGSKK